MKRKPIKISINTVSLCIFILAWIIVVVSIIGNIRVQRYVNERPEVEKHLITGYEQSNELVRSSDYLTEQVRCFIIHRQSAYMKNYWDEINITMSRDKAIEAITATGITPEEQEYIFKAKKESDMLVASEAWAFRMTAEGLGIKQEDMPAEVAAVKLTKEEQALSAEEKRIRAHEYVFGSEYAFSRETIYNSIVAFQESFKTRKNQEIDELSRLTANAITGASINNVLMLLLMATSILIFYLLVTRPFQLYEREMEIAGIGRFNFLKPTGSVETIKFANSFNAIYTDLKEQNNRLMEERFRFLVAIESTKDIVFEYDYPTDTLTFYGDMTQYGPGSMNSRNEKKVPEFLKRQLSRAVHPEDETSLRCFVLDNRDYDVEARVLMNTSGEYIWSRITGTRIWDDAGMMTKLIGRVTSIQQEKEQELALAESRSRDQLTGMYIQDVGVKKVQSILLNKKPEETCCLMLLDMDNFAQLEKVEGRAFSNTILQEVADIIRQITGPDDILIRLGGDEFMMFILDCPKSRAVLLGQKIATEIKKLNTIGAQDLIVSASIGMCTTQVVREYVLLYRCAESTLNYAKQKKRGEAVDYLDATNELGTTLTQIYPEVHLFNEIHEPGHPNEDIVALALELLGKSKNLDDAIFLLLTRVGKRYNLDSISIIQIDAEYLTYSFRYQWTRHKADNKLRHSFYMTADEIAAFASAYDEDGLCEHYTISNQSAMKSILHTAVWNNGVLDSIMNFEVYTENRVWTHEERRLLSELSKIILPFIFKARADAVSQAKTDFLSRISHEIRTPMNAITGMSEIARSVLDQPEKIVQCLDKINLANSYLLGIINDVLDMSRIESGKMELYTSPISLSDLLEEVDTLIRPQAEAKKLELLIESVEISRKLLTDKMRLIQVLINLLGNAVKFTPEGGKVTLRVTLKEEKSDSAVLHFSVSDSGIGIAKEMQQKIFSSFEQADKNTASAYGGTGLGLPIADKLVQMLGGTLRVESDLDRGAEFFFTLAMTYCQDSGEDSGEKAHRETGHNIAGSRILLTEDNEMNREIAKTILEMNGCVVEEAVNGQQAVDMFAGHEPYYYSAILMDIRMPVMDGFEATKLIRLMERADSRSIPIIAMTANAFNDDMKKSIDNGMNAHLSKPIDVSMMIKSLWKCISQQSDDTVPRDKT